MTVISDCIMQQTIADTIEFSGIGLHKGQVVVMRLHPAPINYGIVFRRQDLAAGRLVPARAELFEQSPLCSSLVKDGVYVRTIEHIMSALHALQIDNVLIDLDADEVPIMDGSAADFFEKIKTIGRTEQSEPRTFLRIVAPVEVRREDKMARLLPTKQTNQYQLKLSFQVQFEHALFKGHDQFSIELTADAYEAQLMRARTFCFARDIDAMHQHQLALGGSLDNAVVIDDTGVRNQTGLRFSDEMVRHKILDAVGDLYLLGYQIIGEYQSFKGGHTLNNTLIRQLISQPECYSLVNVTK